MGRKKKNYDKAQGPSKRIENWRRPRSDGSTRGKEDEGEEQAVDGMGGVRKRKAKEKFNQKTRSWGKGPNCGGGVRSLR